MDYLTVEEAIPATGLRVVLTAGVPGPWGESIKALLVHKGIEFAPVAQVGGGANEVNSFGLEKHPSWFVVHCFLLVVDYSRLMII